MSGIRFLLQLSTRPYELATFILSIELVRVVVLLGSFEIRSYNVCLVDPLGGVNFACEF